MKAVRMTLKSVKGIVMMGVLACALVLMATQSAPKVLDWDFSASRDLSIVGWPANPKNKYLEVSGGHLDTPRVASDEIIQWIKTVLAD